MIKARNLQAAASAADLFDSMIGCFDGFSLEMGGLDWKWGVWCIPIRSSVWCSPAGGFFFQKNMTFVKNMIFDDFQMIFHQNGPDLQLNRRTINETGILDPMEF